MKRRTRARAVVLGALIMLVIAFCGCGRKAKPEPLWGAVRIVTTSDRAR